MLLRSLILLVRYFRLPFLHPNFLLFRDHMFAVSDVMFMVFWDWDEGEDEANDKRQDEYSILNSKHFIGIHGYMLVYSVASTQSFEMVQVIRDKILNHLVRFFINPVVPS